MSHNYPYRRSPEGFSSRQCSFATSNNLREESDIYRPSLKPSPHSVPTFTSSKSALESYSSRSVTAENALSLLASCGLEPEDLSVLAGMPENLMTEETLPHLLMEIRQKKAHREHTSSLHQTASRPPAPSLASTWQDSARVCTAEYPSDPSPRSSYSGPREQAESWEDRWGDPGQSGAVRQERPRSASYVVDYNFGQPREEDTRRYEKQAYTVRAGGIREPLASQSSSDYRGFSQSREPAAPPQRKKPLLLAPSKREADDFHGVMPQTFPYACSLCDIAVLSQSDWTLHINGSEHADSQLTVLQMYPDWDCRHESIRKNDYHSEEHREEKSAETAPYRAPQRLGAASSSSERHGPAKEKEYSRVVCAKFAAESVDESCLRKLVKPFGNILNVLMFPVQAFAEMSTSDQAEDIVKYYSRNPVSVKGSPVRFSVSTAFTCLKNSRVVSFSLLPPGKERNSELMAIAKRFGPVKHSLFLPNRVLVEMTNLKDAEKMVQYYASHPLKMKGKNIQVSHSTEHSTLRVPSTDRDSGDRAGSSRYSSQSYRLQARRRSSSPRRRSPSPRRRSPSPRRRSPSPRRRSPTPRRRSPSPRRRSPSPRRRSPSPRRRSREKGDRLHRREDKSSEERVRSSSRHSSQSSRTSRSHTRERDSASGCQSKDKVTDPQKAEVKRDKAVEEILEQESSQQSSCIQAQTKEGVPISKEEHEEGNAIQDIQDQPGFTGGQEEEGFGAVDTDSDIEGMEVIGEDKEDFRSEEDYTEFLEEMEEGADAGILGPQETAEVLGAGSPEVREVLEKEKTGNTDESSTEEVTLQPPADKATNEEKQPVRQEQLDGPDANEEDEPDFPESLEECITLDEIEDEDNDDQTHATEDSSGKKSKEEYKESTSGKVIYIKNLPNGYYTDAQFVKIAKPYGRVKRYFLIRNRQEGFIEMERAADAQKAVKELTMRRVEMDRHVLIIYLSRKYQSLTRGWSPDSDSEDEKEQRKDRKEKRRRGAREDSSSRAKSKMEEEPPAKRAYRDKTTPENLASSKKEEKSTTGEPNSSGLQQKEVKREETDGETSQTSKSMDTQQDTEGVSSSENTRIPSANGVIEQICTEEKNGKTMLDPKNEPLAPYQPGVPMGKEFISQKMGYFCNLCKVIYVSEDEAKNEHCSNITHYQKLKEYLEQNGNPN
ncbi:matrin 3-like 1.1 [Megalops cyprinoides]|uniref:matrin 3-like 1.1 n=1 Tax=Megalops cyprinoides TaxID=118141 RepID=UPI0018653BF5|nr:matrin 3-like 1.1 [Megalops cyprinoides]